ncbi:hypothetical protein ROHU_022255 [Labeo rohita]|uniref:Uncharacterized protein n=1 Tax=Labeo rohita TaxID=84645 RepID=A0A498MWX3_LABRO|nr:hypothetical protein ROHU_022255 [Labeo rohita]
MFKQNTLVQTSSLDSLVPIDVAKLGERNPDNYEAALGHLQAEGIRDVKGIKKWLFYTSPSVRSCLTYLMWQKTCQDATQDSNSSFSIQEGASSLPSVSPGPSSSSRSLSTTSTSSSASCSPDVDWADTFDIPWKKFPEELIQSLERGKRPSPQKRREMVRIVVREMMQKSSDISKRHITIVAKKIVATYPKSLQDVIEGDIIGSGYHSLVKQLQNRIENAKRSTTPKSRKRKLHADSDTDEMPAEKRAPIQETYGCIKWEMKFMHLGETTESQQQSRDELKSLSKQNAPNQDVVKQLTRSTFYTQRKEVNNGKEIKYLLEDWPFLFDEIGMAVHFEELTGVSLKETFVRNLDLKGERLLNYLKTVAVNKSKRLVQSFTNIQLMRREHTGPSGDVLEMVLLLLSYFDEKEDVMFTYVEDTCLAEEVQMGQVPLTPTIVVCGQSCFSAKRWMLSVDRMIVQPSITSFIPALCLMFGSFYVFNIHYPVVLASTLEFLQRCFFSINPERGTKVEKTSKSRLHVNPRVLTLIQDLSDHEWCSQ